MVQNEKCMCGVSRRQALHVGEFFLIQCMKCVDVSLRAAGPAFVVFAITLISGVIYTWFTYIIDKLADPGTLVRSLHILIASTLIFNVFFNYLSTVLTSPGKTPDDYEHPAPDAEARLQDPHDQYYADGFGRFCKKCRRPKPQRTHHCSICRSCVLKMDHHCPWVAQCVGYRNYRTFFLFMFWLWLGCLYVMATMGPTFLKLVKHRPRSEEHTPIVFSCVLALSVSIAVGCLLSWHIYLLCTGQTTIEWYNNRMRAADARKRGQVYHNPWDLGLVGNVASVLGTRDAPYNWLWWIWPTRGLPPGDGLLYSMRRDLSYTMVPRAGDRDKNASDTELGQLSPDVIISGADASHVE
mmetsp:Transcript_55219/g.89496  ORF Transcript_55219/g.89496 Transcript_55219/m.89496 type:complete len:353 (-) Transcript_55219:481-1539(-)